MNRMTVRNIFGYTIARNVNGEPFPVRMVVERCADYEDTGLEPADVRRLKENDRVEREVLTRINFLSVEDLAAAYCQVKAERDALYTTLQRKEWS